MASPHSIIRNILWKSNESIFCTNIRSIYTSDICSNMKSIWWLRINRFSCRILWHLFALPARGANIYSIFCLNIKSIFCSNIKNIFCSNIKRIFCSNIKSIWWERINRFSCRILWHLLALPARGAKVLSTITAHHLDNDHIIYPNWSMICSVNPDWWYLLLSTDISGLFFSNMIFCSLQCDCGDNDCPRYEKLFISDFERSLIFMIRWFPRCNLLLQLEQGF